MFSFETIVLYNFFLFYLGANLGVLSFTLYLYQNTIMFTESNLISCWYVLLSKFFILIVLLLITLIVKSKILVVPYLINEFIFILNFLILFLFILTSSYDFIVMYLATEGISLILYVMGGLLTSNLISVEGTLKYFLLNSIVSSMMIFGISFIFGVFGSIDFLEIQVTLINIFQEVLGSEVYFIFIFSLFSFFFKMAFFPFN
jgi:NADH-quinone oxidoreductase subunit N